MRSHLPLEELFRLLPNLEELEGVRASIMAAAVPDPTKEWASSSAYTTIDKRLISRDDLRGALAASEETVHQQVAGDFRQLREVLEQYWAGDEEGAAFSLIRMGEEQEGRIRHARAQLLYGTALVLSLPLAAKGPQILALRRIGRVLWQQGELEEGREYYARSADLAQAAGERRSEVIARVGCGNMHLFMGRWAEADECYREALDLVDGAEGVDLEIERGQLYNNLGSVTLRQRAFEEAEAWLSRASELWKHVDSPSDLAVCLYNTGLLRMEQGRLPEARAELLKALERPGSPANRSVFATDLSTVCLREGLLTEAERWGREAETYAIASRSPYHMSHMYRGLGNIAREREDAGGITFFEKAVEIARENRQLIAEGEALIDYALLRARIGDVDEALSYLDRAQEIFTQLGARHESERVARTMEEITPSPVRMAAAGD
jgi:tetratricopeptide (TPR) repeat protein